MISGATIADTAMLLIPATTGEYESSMGIRAQTREHVILLKALGVSQIIVAINKMDMAYDTDTDIDIDIDIDTASASTSTGGENKSKISKSWSQKRFLHIKNDLINLFSSLSFHNINKNICFIPISGLNGENITNISNNNYDLLSWYIGPTLIDAIDNLRTPKRHLNKPLRALITSITNEKEKTVTCRCSILQGILHINKHVSLTTSKGIGKIKSIINENTGEILTKLYAGNKGTIIIQDDQTNRSGYEMNLTEGMILCKGPPLVPIVNKFKATIITLNGIVPPILAGSTFEMYLHNTEVLCKVTQLLTMTSSTSTHTSGNSISSSSSAGVADKSKTKLLRKNPKCIGGNKTATIVIEIIHSGSGSDNGSNETGTGESSSSSHSHSVPTVCIEPFQDCKSLGRFALRSVGGTVAVGVCDAVL
jgi:elongation factor 1 alpha-like protein